MKSRRAKVLHGLAGRPLLHWPLAALAELRPARVAVVVGHQAELVASEARRVPGLSDLRVVEQPEQRGTGHAVACAAPAFADFTGDVLVLYGDVPFVRAATLRALVDAHRREDAALSLLTICFEDPTGYGRIVRGPDGSVTGIVEERDATPAERTITEINPGLYCVRSATLFPLLAELRPDNDQGEFYLTDIVGLAARAGRRVLAVRTAGTLEVAGVNTRAELALMEAEARRAAVERWMREGVTFEDPATAYVGPEVTIGGDTVIGPNVVLRGRTRVGRECRVEGTAWIEDSILADRVRVRFGCHLEGAEVGTDAVIGPFARLRQGTVLAERVHLGNFVETKQARLGAGAKANHLTYLGDCDVGPDSNVGAGTITCNYDGFKKHRTSIGARVFIGSDTQLVAPVSLADDVYVGAGTTVTTDVPAGALAVSRAPMRVLPGWTARRRTKGAPAPAPAPPPAGGNAAPAAPRRVPRARKARSVRARARRRR
jgi:bifunctional UDP-N-acetylglucosamine pyrophosphorylase/glucosamine-1-phosphate N-acetyltransferase